MNVTQFVAFAVAGLLAAPLLMAQTGGLPKEDPDEKKATVTKSGLKYFDVKVGDGKEATAGVEVEVHYVGTLRNGKKFDSSRDRNETFKFPLGKGRVIKGWDEGVAGMKEGGKRKLYIPAELAYGKRAIGDDIPANSELLFEVELIKVK